MSPNIEFIPVLNNSERLDFVPIAAQKNLPNWYKKIESYIDGKRTNGQGQTNATIKKCMPVFDCMTSGYLIPLMGDVYVSLDDKGNQYYEWSSWKLIEFHDKQQVHNHPSVINKMTVPKFINYFGIKTPREYSCLFVPPMHHDLPFEILPGIVDTDTYQNVINFPFIMRDEQWTGLIKAGTPIAQVMPFKREKWISQINDTLDGKQIAEKHRHTIKSSIFLGYKRFFYNHKEYK